MVHQRFTQHANFVASSHQPTHGLNEEETVETILWSRRGYRKKLAPILGQNNVVSAPSSDISRSISKTQHVVMS